jgi:hypothetical protein
LPTLRRRTLILIALAASLLASLAFPAAGSAAKRKVPFGFFGTVLSHDWARADVISDAALDQQMALMASSGVESARYPVSWAQVETAPGMYDWARVDRVVAAAARHRIALLINVLLTPRWASSRPNASDPYTRAPADPDRYAEFMRQMVLRYGPSGTFWALNPGLEERGVAVRQWQIWNEQMAPWMWRTRPWPRSYVRLLRGAYRAIHKVDRGAKVVAGSLVAYSNYTQWDGIRDLYRAGGKGFFDVIAVHPFTNARSVRRTVRQTIEIIRRVRARMRARRQGRVPIIVTELTWPAAVGKVPRRRLLGLETTSRGQVQRLKASYRALARVRRKLRVTQAFWYSWATEYDANSTGSDVSFRFAGLNRFSRGVFSPMPLLGAYSSVAAKYEGCRKAADARTCR